MGSLERQDRQGKFMQLVHRGKKDAHSIGFLPDLHHPSEIHLRTIWSGDPKIRERSIHNCRFCGLGLRSLFTVCLTFNPWAPYFFTEAMGQQGFFLSYQAVLSASTNLHISTHHIFTPFFLGSVPIESETFVPFQCKVTNDHFSVC